VVVRVGRHRIARPSRRRASSLSHGDRSHQAEDQSQHKPGRPDRVAPTRQRDGVFRSRLAPCVAGRVSQLSRNCLTCQRRLNTALDPGGFPGLRGQFSRVADTVVRRRQQQSESRGTLSLRLSVAGRTDPAADPVGRSGRCLLSVVLTYRWAEVTPSESGAAPTPRAAPPRAPGAALKQAHRRQGSSRRGPT
jgi:hypothetical protein